MSGSFLGIAACGIVDRLVLCEQDPEDPGILVGGGHRRPVCSPVENEVGDPSVPSSEFLSSRGEFLHGSDHSPSSVNQERAQIGVSPFRDSQEHVLSAARVLPGNEANVSGKLSSVLEAKGISHQGKENRGSQNAHAGNGQKPLADRVCLGKLGNLAIKVFPFLVVSGELSDHGAERLLEKRRDPRVVRVVHKTVQFVFDLGGRDLQYDPVLGQNASEMVDRGRSELDDELPGPVQALKILRLFRLDRHRRYRRRERGFGNGMGVVPVVLVCPDEGLHILGGNQDDRVSHRLELPSPEAGRSAGFHG